MSESLALDAPTGPFSGLEAGIAAPMQRVMLGLLNDAHAVALGTSAVLTLLENDDVEQDQNNDSALKRTSADALRNLCRVSAGQLAERIDRLSMALIADSAGPTGTR